MKGKAKPVAQKKRKDNLGPIELPTMHEAIANSRKVTMHERVDTTRDDVKRLKVRRKEERKLAHNLKRFDFRAV